MIILICYNIEDQIWPELSYKINGSRIHNLKMAVAKEIRISNKFIEKFELFKNTLATTIFIC